MRKGDDGLVVEDLGRLLRRGVDGATDGELLWRFFTHHDGDAFESIVRRHGPMVRGVCGRLLRDRHDADDAFQATFLILARGGARLRDPGRLASWLYSTARRVSSRSRSRAIRRRAEPLVADVPARESDRGEWSDLAPILDAELARLPAIQRDVLVLCLLGGASEQEAARSLDCPVGTVKSRLSRAREALKGRLVRRGIAPAAVLSATSGESFASAASTNLIRATVAAASPGGVVAPAVAALIPGASTMMFARLSWLTLALVGGLGVLGYSQLAWTADPPEAGPRPAASPSQEARTKVENLRNILLAFHNHHQQSDAMPAAAIHGGDGRPLLSWRVALLPFLGEQALYDQFKLDEPWDSPHNKSLIARMPAVFQTPDIPTLLGSTRFRGFDAPGSMFRPEVVDGESGMMGMGMMPGMMMGAGMMGRGGPMGEMAGMMGAGAQPEMMPGGRMGMMPGRMGPGGMMEVGMGGTAKSSGGGPRAQEEKARRATGIDRAAKRAEVEALGMEGMMPGAMGMMGRGGMMGAGGMMRMEGAAAAGRTDGEPNRGTSMSQVTDGTSNTILLVVSDRPVEWTKPEELPFDFAHPSTDGLDRSDPRGLVVGLTDGSVKFLRDAHSAGDFLAALITISGGEVANWDSELASARPSGPRIGESPEGTMGMMGMAAAPRAEDSALEQRLRRVEEKLDRLLKKLGDDESPTPPAGR